MSSVEASTSIGLSSDVPILIPVAESIDTIPAASKSKVVPKSIFIPPVVDTKSIELASADAAFTLKSSSIETSFPLELNKTVEFIVTV